MRVQNLVCASSLSDFHPRNDKAIVQGILISTWAWLRKPSGNHQESVKVYWYPICWYIRWYTWCHHMSSYVIICHQIHQPSSTWTDIRALYFYKPQNLQTLSPSSAVVLLQFTQAGGNALGTMVASSSANDTFRQLFKKTKMVDIFEDMILVYL